MWKIAEEFTGSSEFVDIVWEPDVSTGKVARERRLTSAAARQKTNLVIAGEVTVKVTR